MSTVAATAESAESMGGTLVEPSQAANADPFAQQKEDGEVAEYLAQRTLQHNGEESAFPGMSTQGTSVEKEGEASTEEKTDTGTDDKTATAAGQEQQAGSEQTQGSQAQTAQSDAQTGKKAGQDDGTQQQQQQQQEAGKTDKTAQQQQQQQQGSQTDKGKQETTHQLSEKALRRRLSKAERTGKAQAQAEQAAEIQSLRQELAQLKAQQQGGQAQGGQSQQQQQQQGAGDQTQQQQQSQQQDQTQTQQQTDPPSLQDKNADGTLKYATTDEWAEAMDEWVAADEAAAGTQQQQQQGSQTQQQQGPSAQTQTQTQQQQQDQTPEQQEETARELWAADFKDLVEILDETDDTPDEQDSVAEQLQAALKDTNKDIRLEADVLGYIVTDAEADALPIIKKFLKSPRFSRRVANKTTLEDKIGLIQEGIASTTTQTQQQQQTRQTRQPLRTGANAPVVVEDSDYENMDVYLRKRSMQESQRQSLGFL